MTYTLHGRELKVGDRVWNVLDQKWITVNEVHSISHTFAFYAWDECTYQSTLGAIPPPLGWVEGKPVRIGSQMYLSNGDSFTVSYWTSKVDDLSWSPPKRTEQRWVIFTGAGNVMLSSASAEIAESYRGSHQVFGPFEVEVK